MNLQERYESNYAELIRCFADETTGVSSEGITALHLPICGRGYDKALIKIAFIGEETRGWGKMSDFLADAIIDPRSAGRSWESSIHTFEFTKWTNNFGTTFWDTVLKLLAVFNGMSDWKAIKRGKFPELLRSFVWANSNSLEGYAVSAQENGADYAAWLKFKEASRRFDRLQLVLDSFDPSLVVVMNWDSAGHYFPPDLVWEHLGDHLDYSFNTTSAAHIFKTAHPTWLNQNELYGPTLELIAGKWNALSQGNVLDRQTDQV